MASFTQFLERSWNLSKAGGGGGGGGSSTRQLADMDSSLPSWKGLRLVNSSILRKYPYLLLRGKL